MGFKAMEFMVEYVRAFSVDRTVEHFQGFLTTYEGLLGLIVLLQIGLTFYREVFSLILIVLSTTKDIVVIILLFLKFLLSEPLNCFNIMILALRQLRYALHLQIFLAHQSSPLDGRVRTWDAKDQKRVDRQMKELILYSVGPSSPKVSAPRK